MTHKFDEMNRELYLRFDVDFKTEKYLEEIFVYSFAKKNKLNTPFESMYVDVENYQDEHMFGANYRDGTLSEGDKFLLMSNSYARRIAGHCILLNTGFDNNEIAIDYIDKLYLASHQMTHRDRDFQTVCYSAATSLMASYEPQLNLNGLGLYLACVASSFERINFPYKVDKIIEYSDILDFFNSLDDEEILTFPNLNKFIEKNVH